MTKIRKEEGKRESRKAKEKSKTQNFKSMMS